MSKLSEFWLAALMNRQVRQVGYVLLLLVVASCKTIQPQAPPETFSPATYTPTISEVNIPINISIPGMSLSINKKVQGTLYEDKDLEDHGGDNLMLTVKKKSDILLDVDGNEILYALPLDIWLKTGFKINTFGLNLSNYKEGSCAILLRFRSKVEIDSLWRVNVTTSPDGYEWITKPTISIGGLNIPVTMIANKILGKQLPMIAAAIDEQAKESLGIKKYVEEIWRKLQDPLLISSSPEFWMTIQPVAIHMLPFSGNKGSLNSSIGIHAYVQSIVGEKPSVPATKLSPLRILPQMSNDIHISLATDISYEHASALAAEKLVGKTFSFKNDKYQVVVTGVKIYANKNKLISKIDLEGSIKGSVYLEGIPYFDVPSLSIKMKQVDFHLQTKDALTKTASWMLHGTFLHKIEPQLNYPLREQLLQSKTLLQKTLKERKLSNFILLDGTVEELLPSDILLTPATIKTIVNAKGKIEVRVEGFE